MKAALTKKENIATDADNIVEHSVIAVGKEFDEVDRAIILFLNSLPNASVNENATRLRQSRAERLQRAV